MYKTIKVLLLPGDIRYHTIKIGSPISHILEFDYIKNCKIPDFFKPLRVFLRNDQGGKWYENESDYSTPITEDISLIIITGRVIGD